MSWAKLDDKFWANPKVDAVGLDAVGLYAVALSYCGDQLTDGFVPEPRAVSLARGRRRLVKALVDGGLWAEVEGGYRVVDYLDYNPSRSEVKFRQRVGARRNALHRDRELIAAVRLRDGDLCRYCGIVVDWTDRRGKSGGTYDHVDPRGENEVENVVVACRGCNSSKGRRTPAQAGLELIKI